MNVEKEIKNIKFGLAVLTFGYLVLVAIVVYTAHIHIP